MRTVAASLLMLGITLVATEVILRSFAPLHLSGIQRAYRYDEELGYRLKEGIHDFEDKDFLEEIRVNALGTVNFQESFDAYPVRIFALGDSYTQGTGLPSDASYPFQLDLVLNLDAEGFYRPRIGVVNLGLAAFGGEQSLLTLDRYVTRLGAPAAVLYMGSDNDHEDDVLFESGYRHRHIVEGSPGWGALVAPLQWAARFEVFKRAKIAVGTLRRMALAEPAGEAPAGSATPAPSVAELSWPVLAKLREACDRHGAVLVISWANAGSPSYAWLRDRAGEEGIRFADWWPRVESFRAQVPELPLVNPHSGGHFRSWVNGVMAETYAAELRAAGIIATESSSDPLGR